MITTIVLFIGLIAFALASDMLGLPFTEFMNRLPKGHRRAVLAGLFLVAFGGLYIERTDSRDAALSDDALGGSAFRLVDLRPLANFPLTHLTTVPRGEVTLAGVPFTILATNAAIFQTQNRALPYLPVEGLLPMRVESAVAVHALLNGGFVDAGFQGQKIGALILSFDDGSVHSIPLVAWETVRETWVYKSSSFAQRRDSFKLPQLGVDWRNVWLDDETRANEGATGFVDMLTVFLPELYRARTLTAVTIRDTSAETVGSLDPSLVLLAVTVEFREK